MKVPVRLYAQLRDLSGKEELELDLPEGRTAAELLEELYRQLPVLRSHDRGILLGAGVEFVDRTYRIRAGEEISIMPPVQGG